MGAGSRPENAFMVVKHRRRQGDEQEEAVWERKWVGGVQGKQDQQKGKSKGENIECQRTLHCFQFPLINDEDIWTDDCGIEPITLIPPQRGVARRAGTEPDTKTDALNICHFPNLLLTRGFQVRGRSLLGKSCDLKWFNWNYLTDLINELNKTKWIKSDQNIHTSVNMYCTWIHALLSS